VTDLLDHDLDQLRGQAPDLGRGQARDLDGESSRAVPPAGAVPSPAVYRAVQVLELMGRRREPLTITEVAGGLSLAKSTVSNLLISLEAAGMVRRSRRGWLLGYKVLELSRSMLVSTEVVGEFRRAALTLPALRGETTVLAVLEGMDVLYVARNDGQQTVRFVNEIGSRMPAVVTGLGKAMLASLDDDELDRRLGTIGELPRLTERSHRTVAALRADLTRIRARGYAVDDEQNTVGVMCFGVALEDVATPTAVSVSMITRRVTAEGRPQLVEDLHTLAGRLARVEKL